MHTIDSFPRQRIMDIICEVETEEVGPSQGGAQGFRQKKDWFFRNENNMTM